MQQAKTVGGLLQNTLDPTALPLRKSTGITPKAGETATPQICRQHHLVLITR